MKLETLLFGDYSKRQLKKIKGAADAVDALADKFKSMSDEELRAVTPEFRERLSNGETLEQLLPEAFAAVREAADRVLGKRPFRVQVLGGILLHQGRIAEMKTGEGKTLVATMPAYLNALTGKGVHIVTVNDYLAVRDAGEMGRIYEYLGLRTGVITKDMSAAEKRRNYAADITYGTNNEFGFDYLRDNLQTSLEAQMQRGHNFAIIDEVDSILIDEARTPLIISGLSGKSTDIYEKCDAAVRKLSKKVIKELDTKAETDDENFDYIVDEKHSSAVLTPRGAKKIEEFFGIDNLNDPENASIAHSVNQSIHAYGVKKRDVDYVVKDGEIIIVDPFTGRLMPGRRYQDGLHQALEAKEKVNIKSEMKVTATVTIQNYFRMYRKLSGMTGTALTEEEEFREIYGLDVVEVPTNKPMIRVDHPDRIFTDESSKFRAIIELVEQCRAKSQPVLVGTASVEKSEVLSRMLKAKGIQHNVLNAKNHEREADIIAEAGRAGAVTIATNMAGRGTDIMLGGNPEHMAKQEMARMGIHPELIALSTGTVPTENQDIKNARNTFRIYFEKFREQIIPEREKVIAAGGLYIIGSERHESRRIDNQLRGRSGRQGDPGESTFFISLQDDLMRLFADPARLQKLSSLAANLTDGSGDMSQNISLFSNVIESAQKRIESRNFKIRKNVLEYDDVLNEQRKTIYEQRDEILHEGNLSDKVKQMIASTISESVESATSGANKSEWDLEALRRKYLGWVCHEDELIYSEEELKHVSAEDIEKLLQDNAEELYSSREAEVGEDRFRRFERNTLLHNIDEMWLDHIDDMENLKQNVMLQSYAHKDPLTEYKLLGSNMFGDLITEIRDKTAREMLTEKIPEVIIITPEMIKNMRMGRSIEQNKKSAPVASSAEKIDRNALCPCGSGKKYKKCCGAKISGGGDS
ncbi:MAG: preprotein translocase subunit SecA [Clostridiales bacterium]|nr:preprotein translocase subunit SecA [Clostridiales bacterium]MDD7595630.1 preprotein translocase subunit SecA [Clostridiales bacterium]